MRRWIWMPCLALHGMACSDYGLAGKPDTETTPETEPEPEPEPEPDTAVEPIDCEGVSFDDWAWAASPPFAEEADPTDGSGSFWHEVAFAPDGYTAVSLPHQDIPVGNDRIYHAHFTLTELPPDVSLGLQSDDGLRVYVNGASVGAWGGGWQEEGCVNEEASCKEHEQVDPISITHLLTTGENTIAARVTNPVVSAYFSIIPECVEP
jgi:hypothetical protein